MLPAVSKLRAALAVAVALLGASPGSSADEAAPGRAALADDADVDAFVAGFMEPELRAGKVPGAVFVLVRAGKPPLARGFGVSDLARGAPVDPDRTLFRVASVSKLFTSVAAMQLVESGALALDDDVNARLRALRVPDAFGEPVRVRHLLTHTAGFDDRLIGMTSGTEDGREPLAAHVARRLPRRIAPPGKVFSYSNYGMALLGVVVEDVAGRPFESVVEERILAPLGMTRSSFSPSAERRADLGPGYALRNDAPLPIPYDFPNVAPAGGLVATGADMGRFVAALLAGGAGPNGRILAPATLADMTTQHFTHDSTLPGVGWGFMERRHGDVTTWEHSGDLGGFASLLFLVPAADAGFFVSFNVDDLRIRELFVRAFLERYFPQPARPLPAPPPGSEARAAAARGWYRWNRVTREDLSKPLAFPLRVDTREAGGIRLVVPGGVIPPIDLSEVLPGKYAVADGDERAVLATGADGRVETLFVGAFGLPFAFDRLPWAKWPPVQLAGLAGGTVLALSALVGWPIAAHRRRRRGDPPAPARARMAAAFGVAASIGWLGLGLGLAGLLSSLPPGSLLREVPGALPPILCFGVVGALATFPFAGFALLGLARGWWSRTFRIHFALVAAGAAVLLAVFHDWNLVGFHY
jgi:CubicO group peptidase (beta-lactamase class C family)